MKPKIKVVKTKEELKYLYDRSAMTWEGLREEDFELAINECGVEDTTGYIIKGETMNEICRLTGSNAYPDDLDIFALDKYHGLAMYYGARWMDDIIDNNGRREHYNPFR